MFQENDQVYINHPDEDYHGETGIVIAIDRYGPFLYQVRMNDGDYWFNAEDVVATDPRVSAPETQGVHDFSHSGLGIGGLARHVEEPFVPTIRQMKRWEQMEQQARYCRRCGESDVFDGAMFTTGGGNVCDDCFG